MLEFFGATSRKHRAVAKTQMRSIVENGDIAFAQQTGDRAERAAKSAVEKHGVFALEKFRDAPFEFAMQIGHSGKHRRTACAQTVGASAPHAPRR